MILKICNFKKVNRDRKSKNYADKVNYRNKIEFNGCYRTKVNFNTFAIYPQL